MTSATDQADSKDATGNIQDLLHKGSSTSIAATMYKFDTTVTASTTHSAGTTYRTSTTYVTDTTQVPYTMQAASTTHVADITH